MIFPRYVNEIKELFTCFFALLRYFSYTYPHFLSWILDRWRRGSAKRWETIPTLPILELFTLFKHFFLTLIHTFWTLFTLFELSIGQVRINWKVRDLSFPSKYRVYSFGWSWPLCPIPLDTMDYNDWKWRMKLSNTFHSRHTR